MCNSTPIYSGTKNEKLEKKTEKSSDFGSEQLKVFVRMNG